MAMRGQSQIVVFVLLLLISLLLVFAAVSWGSGVSQKNIDVGRVTAAENWMRELDRAIQSVVRAGGSVQLDYPLDGQIGLADVGLNDTVEVSMPVTLDLPNYWLNLTAAGESGLIRQRKDGDMLRIQLLYPPRPGFAVDLFTEGAQIATPSAVLVERNSTYVQNIGGTNYTVVRIRLGFV